MSEDEAIEILKHVNIVRKFSGVYSTTEIIHEAIETILDLYKKEKEKNKELSIIKEGIRVLQNNGLMDEQYIVIANWNLKNTSYKHLLDDYISKEKIRAKIKELENELKYENFRDGNLIQINAFKKILEEN